MTRPHLLAGGGERGVGVRRGEERRSWRAAAGRRVRRARGARRLDLGGWCEEEHERARRAVAEVGADGLLAAVPPHRAVVDERLDRRRDAPVDGRQCPQRARVRIDQPQRRDDRGRLVQVGLAPLGDEERLEDGVDLQVVEARGRAARRRRVPLLGLGVEREQREARRRDGVALRAAGDREAAAALVVDAGQHLPVVERVRLALERAQLLVR